MLSPAIFRVCCLAVMAPALTKAVRQADSLTHLLMPQKNLALLPSKIDQLCSNDRTAALNGPGKLPRAYKGGSVNNGNILSNGDSMHFKQFPYNRPLENIKQLNANGLKNGILNSNSSLKTVNNVNGHYSYVGGLSPAYDSGEFVNKMNEDTLGSDVKMGLINANTSLESDFQSKNFSHQCLSPASSNMSPCGSEFVKDIPTKSPVESLLSPLGSPKSASGESTSTVTTHNPQVVTFTELEEAKKGHHDLKRRSEDLMLRLRKLQMLRLDGHMCGQLKALISHYQRTLSIPCQRQQRQNGSRRIKDPTDLKAGLLHGESVRSLSTAALISLVRSIESSNSTMSKALQPTQGSSEIGSSLLGDTEEVKLKSEECKQVKQAVGSLLTCVNHLESAIDPDATESSSGDESFDELDGCDDKKTNYIPLSKHSSWIWANDRAPIAKRWTFLQSQVQDLGYRLRQFSDLLVQAREAKGEVCFEDSVQSDPVSECSTLHPTASSSSTDHSHLLKKALRSVNGCLGNSSIVASSCGFPSICGVSSSAESCPGGLPERGVGQISGDDCSSVSRTRPRVISSFRKRKLLRTSALHIISKKAARFANVKCNCNSRPDVMPCILCSGRYNNTLSVDPNVMPLLERVALLQPTFHPMLSLQKDVSIALHFENHLRKSEKYYSIPSPGPSPVKRSHFELKSRGLIDHARHHSRKLAKHAAQTLLTSERYKNNRHSTHNSSKLRSQSFAFKKWREMQKGSFKNKHLKSWSVTSNCSSRQESPVHSPSVFEDGLLLNSLPGKDSPLPDFIRRRRDEHHFDIDNMVIPYTMKMSFQQIQYKEIVTPGWRICDANSERDLEGTELENEDTSEELVAIRHDKAEVEERKNNLRISAKIGIGGIRKGRRRYYDSRADSSGANTPDHLSFYPQDIMFADSNSFVSGGPSSPALSPPATPGSFHTMSDDSQPPSGSHTPSVASIERKRTISWNASLRRDKSEDSSAPADEAFEIQPYERRTFPLSDEQYEEMLQENEEADIKMEQIPETYINEPSSPGSMDTSSSTSSAFEDEDDETADPEWTVVQRQSEPNRTLVLKLAKR